MNRETLRKLAATQMPSSMSMIQRTAQSPSAAPPIAPPQSVTVQPTGANKSAALGTNQNADVPMKKAGTIDHAFTEQSPDMHSTDLMKWPVSDKIAADKLKGGLADKKKPSDFDPSKLHEGMKVEREHSSNTDVQKEISMDHLTEDPEYYKKLKKIEKEAGFFGNIRERLRSSGPTVIYTGNDTDAFSSINDIEDYLREHHERINELERHLMKQTPVKKEEKRDFTIGNGGKPPQYTLSKEGAVGVRPPMAGARMLPTAPRTDPRVAGQLAAMNKFQVGGPTATGIQAAPQTASGLDLAAPQKFGYGVQAPQGMPGQQAIQTQQPGMMQGWNPNTPSGLELAMDPMKARGRVSMASVYEQGVKEALEKFALLPLIPAAGAALAAAAPHVGRFLAGKAAPMLLQGAMGGLQSKAQGGSFLGGAVPGAIGGAVPGVGGMAAGMGAGMLMNR